MTSTIAPTVVIDHRARAWVNLHDGLGFTEVCSITRPVPTLRRLASRFEEEPGATWARRARLVWAVAAFMTAATR